MGTNKVEIIIGAKDETNKGFLGVRGSLKSLASDVNLFKSALLGIGGVKLLGPMIMSVTGAAKEWGLAVDDIVDQTGAAGEEASKLLVIAKRTGIGMEESAGIFAKFGKSISSAKDEMGKAAAKGEQSDDIFSRMGFTLEDLSQSSMYEMFQKLTDKMRDMADGADKDRVAMEMFGKSGYKMHDMLSITREEMDKSIQKAQAMGLIISGDTAAAWEQFDRQLQEVKGSTSRLAIGIGNELLPSLQNLLTKVEDATTAWGTLDDAQRKAAARSIELVGEVGGIIAALWGAEKAATALKGALLLLSRHPVITIGIAFALASQPLSELVEKERAEQEKRSGGKYVIVGNHTEFQKNADAPAKPGADYGDYLLKEMESGAFSPSAENPDPFKLRPTTAGGGGGKELDNMREKLANMIADFNAKIMQETGTTFQGNAAKLAAEVTKATREFNEMDAKGIDTSAGRSKLDEYGKIETEKYTKEQTKALLTLQNETASINAEITGDYVAAAETRYQAEILRIQDLAEKRRKDAGNTTAVVEWEIKAIRKAEQDKVQMFADGAAREHEQRLNSLQYQRDVLGMTTSVFTAAYQRELQAFVDTNTLKLQNATMTAEERMRLEQKVSSSVEQLHRLAGQNVNTAWGEAMRRMNADSYDYAGRITSMFGEMGSTISTALYETISGTGNGAKNLIGDLCNSALKMWADMITQMYIMTPMKNWMSSVLGGMFGGSSGGGSDSQSLTRSIMAQSKAGGGYMAGPGTGTSDSILSWLSNGEFVVKAAAVQKYGVGMFDSLNQMRIPRFASGGPVSGGSGRTGGVMQPNVDIKIINQTGTQAKARQQSSFTSETNTAVISIVLEALESDAMGLRTVVGGLR